MPPPPPPPPARTQPRACLNVRRWFAHRLPLHSALLLWDRKCTSRAPVAPQLYERLSALTSQLAACPHPRLHTLLLRSRCAMCRHLACPPACLSACLPTRLLRACVHADARSTCAFRLSHRTQAPSRLAGSRPPHSVCESPPAYVRTPVPHLLPTCLLLEAPQRISQSSLPSPSPRKRRWQPPASRALRPRRGGCGPPTCAQG